MQASGQGGSENITQYDTELASRLAMAGAALLAAAETSKASNVGGKPAPAKPPRDKGGTAAHQGPASSAASGDVGTGVPVEAQGLTGSDGQQLVGVGSTDHDRLQQIIAMLHQPPSPPPPLPPMPVSGPPSGPQSASLASSAAAAAAAAAKARLPSTSSSLPASSRKGVVQPWQQAPQLTLPPGVSFSDPRNLYNKGQAFPIMGKAAPYQGPPAAYLQSQPTQPSQRAPVAQHGQVSRGHGQGGSAGQVSRAGQAGKAVPGHPLAHGVIAAPAQSQQQQQQQPTATNKQQPQQPCQPVANGFHPPPPRLPSLQAPPKQPSGATGSGPSQAPVTHSLMVGSTLASNVEGAASPWQAASTNGGSQSLQQQAVLKPQAVTAGQGVQYLASAEQPQESGAPMPLTVQRGQTAAFQALSQAAQDYGPNRAKGPSQSMLNSQQQDALDNLFQGS